MNIQTVRDNLRNTIAGKEYMLQELQGMKFNEIGKDVANDATIKFLTINVDELKRILQDVEQCVDQFEKLKKENSDMGWELNPDRSGGGGWTAEELDPNRGWK